MMTLATANLVHVLHLLLAVITGIHPNTSPGRTFSAVRCPNNGRTLCGIDPPTESHDGVSRGQCNGACSRVNGCNWFNYVDKSGQGSRGLCQLYDRHPQVGYTSYCTLYKSSSMPLMISAHTDYPGTLIQQHYNGTTDFQKTWNEFKVGFGDVAGNYWIGNDQLHSLTTMSGVPRRLRVDLQARYDCQWYWAEYSTFSVGTETSGYRLTIGGYTGNAGDTMTDPNHPWTLLNGMKFTTSDRDNDLENFNCANTPYVSPTGPIVCPGAFWYNACSFVLINLPVDCYPGFSWLTLPVSQDWADQQLYYSRMTAI